MSRRTASWAYAVLLMLAPIAVMAALVTLIWERDSRRSILSIHPGLELPNRYESFRERALDPGGQSRPFALRDRIDTPGQVNIAWPLQKRDNCPGQATVYMIEEPRSEEEAEVRILLGKFEASLPVTPGRWFQFPYEIGVELCPGFYRVKFRGIYSCNPWKNNVDEFDGPLLEVEDSESWACNWRNQFGD